jgi:hypothetical protein
VSDERIDLTAEEAIALLPAGEYVHTFRNPGGIMLGADWDRAEIQTAIHKAGVRTLAGGVAMAVGHGLAIYDGGGWLFVATDAGAISALKAAKVPT